MKPSSGTAILELMVGVFIAALAMVPLVSLDGAAGRYLRGMDERATANQTVRLIIDVITRDIRQAGFDPRGTGLVPIIAANASLLGLQQDTDGDGDIDRHSRELTTYAFRHAQGTLSRIIGQQSMPLATGLPADGFRLNYLDAAARILPMGADGLDDAAREAVRLVSVAVTVRDTLGKPLASARTSVAVRNRPRLTHTQSPESES